MEDTSILLSSFFVERGRTPTIRDSVIVTNRVSKLYLCAMLNLAALKKMPHSALNSTTSNSSSPQRRFLLYRQTPAQHTLSVDAPDGQSDWHLSVDSALLGTEHRLGDRIDLSQHAGSPHVCHIFPSVTTVRHNVAVHISYQLPNCHICGRPVLLLV